MFGDQRSCWRKRRQWPLIYFSPSGPARVSARPVGSLGSWSLFPKFPAGWEIDEPLCLRICQDRGRDTAPRLGYSPLAWAPVSNRCLVTSQTPPSPHPTREQHTSHGPQLFSGSRTYRQLGLRYSQTHYSGEGLWSHFGGDRPVSAWAVQPEAQRRAL